MVLVPLTAALVVLLPGPRAALAASQQGASITTGYYQTCAIETGQAYCWGPNGSGQLGDGNTVNSGIPVAVDTSGVLAGKTLTQVSAGDGYMCALDTSGAAYCWGTNESGELGDGTAVSFSDVPVQVDASGVLAGKILVQIAAGQQQACVLDSTGQVYCWGENIYGELGDGSGADTDVPVAVDTSKKLTGLAANESEVSTCAVDASGSAYCWGINFNGQLGDGTTDNSSVPVAVATSGVLAGKTLTQISADGFSGPVR